ncbi:hypothetical protein GCM10027422_48280 [Hymenobacter arcticus]
MLLTASASLPPITLCRGQETTIFSFVTNRGKTACLCEGAKQAYLTYRFGTAAKVDLQYPAVLDRGSWKKFTYAFYYRGGGTDNAGVDNNQVSFSNSGVKYRLYQEYSAEEEAKSGNGDDVGIEVTIKGSATLIGSKGGTVFGTILGFRDNNKIGKGELE